MRRNYSVCKRGIEEHCLMKLRDLGSSSFFSCFSHKNDFGGLYGHFSKKTKRLEVQKKKHQSSIYFFNLPK
jgi:hypothetical protein